ncbi:putative 2-alkenal reductase [Mycobacterium intracellulare 1956]|uniref:Putative 2-alkenal reductase n=1 Tax=Mycobacterium intracellulare 1956 TaxID=1299331 RepID=X8CBU6_MYCIT|nr:putative 2-alkenal reductase [Mycobacterium intracellulare 1956]
MPDLPNRQVLLRRRPSGLVRPDDTEMVTAPAPEPAEGEALLRTTYVGIDAAARTWLDDQPSYLPPVQLGEVIRAAGIGEVVASRCDAFAVGDVVTTLTGFQEYVIIRDDLFSTPIPGEDDQLAIMSVYGPTGATAYFGMTDIGRPQPGRPSWCRRPRGPPGRWPGKSPRSPAPGWWASRAARRNAGRWWRTSGSTRASTTRTTTSSRRSKSIARNGWTSTSTTWAGPSSTPSWAGWPPARAWCCAASSPAT